MKKRPTDKEFDAWERHVRVAGQLGKAQASTVLSELRRLRDEREAMRATVGKLVAAYALTTQDGLLDARALMTWGKPIEEAVAVLEST